MEAMQYFLIVLNIMVVVSSSPLPNCQNKNMTVYDAIIERCPNIKVIEQFAKQDVFNDCKDFCKINETTLSKNTEDDYLCRIYYKSFTLFCTEMILNGITFDNDKLIPDLNNYKVDDLCTANSSLNSRIFNNKNMCTKLCYNYDGSPSRLCTLAYYYCNFTSIKRDVVNIDNTGRVKNTKPDTKAQINENSQLDINNSMNHDKAIIDSKVVSVTNSLSVKASGKSSEITSVQMGGENDIDETPKNNVNTKPSEDVDKPHKKTDVENLTTKTDVEEPLMKADEKPPTKADEKPPTKADEKPPTKADVEKSSTIYKNISSASPPVQHQEQIDPKDETFEPADDGRYIPQENDVAPAFEDNDDEQLVNNYEDPKIMGSNNEPKKQKPETVEGEPANYNNTEDLDGESYFFFYFMVVCVLFVLGYVGYHNRQKVLALVLEGKRGKRQYRRRPNSANYHKLDSNLEEALSSSCSKNSSHVIY